ncbi:hypothetical protein [Cupriavidus consociatus]|uniref:hypothetical protein n=1 Tax=Cupriavidus consociatus TaxID=2821357 RepID=UPI001AE50251|nr:MULTISPECIES: hypothetical protein [unclassified Cupriavidus]MBP0619249.1 hypothetical protein [Cupriavidus sp. LEh25]MDK2655896.1 hypothetical protein [Cupriavidus sp. LEh21]
MTVNMPSLNSVTGREPGNRYARNTRPYMASNNAVRRKPSEVLMHNSNDRPDVADIAVLGYN